MSNNLIRISILITGFIISGLISQTLLNTSEEAKISLSISENRYITGKKYLNINMCSKKKNENKIFLEVGWDASWRDNENWDAAWVFFKNGQKPNQICSASAKNAEINISADSLGFYIYRNNISQGDNQFQVSVVLEDDIKTTKFYGLEMVYIPQGSFELGTVKSFSDRNEINTSRGSQTSPINAFFRYDPKAQDAYGGIFSVNDESPINIGKNRNDLFYVDAQIPGVNTYSGDQNGVLGSNWPKGYNAFYQMKYELTQGQYCNFLNSLLPEQAKLRFNPNIIYNGWKKEAYRNTIELKSGKYVTAHPYRACNFLNYWDMLAYADWAGLRPMSELEFEKSARGPEPAVWREFVWGENELAQGGFKKTTTLYDSDGKPAERENGDEHVNGNVHCILLDYKDYQDVCEMAVADRYVWVFMV